MLQQTWAGVLPVGRELAKGTGVHGERGCCGAWAAPEPGWSSLSGLWDSPVVRMTCCPSDHGAEVQPASWQEECAVARVCVWALGLEVPQSALYFEFVGNAVFTFGSSESHQTKPF